MVHHEDFESIGYRVFKALAFAEGAAAGVHLMESLAGTVFSAGDVQAWHAYYMEHEVDL